MAEYIKKRNVSWDKIKETLDNAAEINHREKHYDDFRYFFDCFEKVDEETILKFEILSPSNFGMLKAMNRMLIEEKKGLKKKIEDFIEKCQNLDDEKTVAIERIQDIESQIFKMRNCDNCGNHDECFDGWKGSKCEDDTLKNMVSIVFSIKASTTSVPISFILNTRTGISP